MDKFIFIKDIGNKSWAEIVEEDEEYIRETEKIRQAAKRPRAESSHRSPPSKSPRKCETDQKVKNQCKKKIRFEKDENLTNLVCDSLKYERPRLRQQSLAWSERLRSSPKKDAPAKIEKKTPPSKKAVAAPSTATESRRKTPTHNSRSSRSSGSKHLLNAENSKTSASKSPAKSTKERSSTSSTNWRKKPLLDEDSQNTLTEVAQITKQVVLKPREDDNTQSCFGAERPKRAANAPKRYPLPETGNFEEDPGVISRREKDLSKGYNSEVYKRYRELIAKKDRVKGVHPKTPNKYLKMPRRSWDTQVRVWRRLLYAAVDMEIPSDASFMSSLNTSENCSETTSERDVMEVHCELDEDLTLVGLNNNDESTMKALSSAMTKTKGPTDFAHLANGRTK